MLMFFNPLLIAYGTEFVYTYSVTRFACINVRW